MSVEILLVRHGQDQDNEKNIMNGRRDNPLTKLGREEAAQARDRITKEKLTTIYCSPLMRAKETAEIIAKPFGLMPQTDSRLMERDFGILTGKSNKELLEYCKNIIKTDNNLYVLDGQGVERFQEVLRRAKSFIRDVAEKHQGETIVVVCHNDIAKMIQAAVWKREIEDVLKNTPFLENASVTELILS